MLLIIMAAHGILYRSARKIIARRRSQRQIKLLITLALTPAAPMAAIGCERCGTQQPRGSCQTSEERSPVCYLGMRLLEKIERSNERLEQALFGRYQKADGCDRGVTCDHTAWETIAPATAPESDLPLPLPPATIEPFMPQSTPVGTGVVTEPSEDPFRDDPLELQPQSHNRYRPTTQHLRAIPYDPAAAVPVTPSGANRYASHQVPANQASVQQVTTGEVAVRPSSVEPAVVRRTPLPSATMSPTVSPAVVQAAVMIRLAD